MNIWYIYPTLIFLSMGFIFILIQFVRLSKRYDFLHLRCDSAEGFIKSMDKSYTGYRQTATESFDRIESKLASIESDLSNDVGGLQKQHEKVSKYMEILYQRTDELKKVDEELSFKASAAYGEMAIAIGNINGLIIGVQELQGAKKSKKKKSKGNGGGNV